MLFLPYRSEYVCDGKEHERMPRRDNRLKTLIESENEWTKRQKNIQML